MSITVGEFLIFRLHEIGIDKVFGVPGDFVLGFNKLLEKHTNLIQWIGTCSELTAAYAADGYARMRGVGALVTTYSVGELSALNGVAGSFAEHVPVVVITGSPTTIDQKECPLLHHTLGDYNIPKRMFKSIVVASTTLDNPATAPDEIDRVLTECLYHHLPCYISLPSDIVYQPCRSITEIPLRLREPTVDLNALHEALEEAVNLITKSENPIVVADVELLRYKLNKEFRALIEKSGLPYVTMMMGKAILEEEHPQFIGLYAGQNSREYVRNRVNQSDCILVLGALMTDLNTGGFTVQWDPQRVISAHRFQVTIKHHVYPNVTLKEFIVGLAKRLPSRDLNKSNIIPAFEGCTHRKTREFIPQVNSPITHKRFFDRISHFIPENAIVVVDTGNSMFGVAETMLPRDATFIGQIFYGSIGYAIGGALGASLAEPHRPVVLFIGDGSFQVTASDFSTIIRNRCNIVTFLMNNEGYTIERMIVDGSFNDLQPWKYSLLPKVFGGREGVDVRTEGELEIALKEVKFGETTPHLIEFHLDRWDCSPALKNAGTAMRKRNFIPL